MPALTDLKLIASGKVREIYDLDDELLLFAQRKVHDYFPLDLTLTGLALGGLAKRRTKSRCNSSWAT